MSVDPNRTAPTPPPLPLSDDGVQPPPLPGVTIPPPASESRASARVGASVSLVGQKLDEYVVIKELGTGGMGVVYLAQDMLSPTGERVAIKVLQDDACRDVRLRHLFLKEADNMHAMRHAAIMPVLKVVRSEERPYYVMPFMEGGSLADRRVEGKPALAFEQLLPLVTQVAEALEYTHDKRGVIHRDIKPENILLDGKGKAYLSDFGLNRTVFNDTLLPNAKELGWTVGTKPYMAPEVVMGNAGDFRVDIYSFGAMLYELCTGHRPYSGSSTDEVFAKIRLGPPPALAKMQAPPPQDWITVIEGAMARELDARYAHMRYLVEDLHRMARKEPALGPGNRADGAQRATPQQRPKEAQAKVPPQTGTATAAPKSSSAAPVLAVVGVLLFAGAAAGGYWVWKHGLPGATSAPQRTAGTSDPAVATPPSSSEPTPRSAQPTSPPEVAKRTPDEIYALLLSAIEADDIKAIKEYADQLSPVDRATLEGKDSLLGRAVYHGNLATLRTLVEAKVGFDTPDSQGRKALHLAAMEGRDEIVEYLVRDLKHPLGVGENATGATPLHLACEQGKTSTAKLLVSLGASVRATDALNRTPLHTASAKGQTACVEAMLGAQGVEVDATDARGQSALHLAAGADDAGAVRLLLAKGANPARKDKAGRTPLDVAKEARAQRAAALLQ